MEKKFRITYGGWYQRTTLHLSEIYDLFARGVSNLDLSEEKLKEFQGKLDLVEISREAGYLEFVLARTGSGIEIRYYEDGLYILEISSNDIKNSERILEDYYNNALGPAIAYLFSLGAPTPKILANIKTIHPTVISSTSDDLDSFSLDTQEFGNIYSKIISRDIVVYKTPH